jgi:hypothetical protein
MRKITKRSAAIITASVVALGGGAAWAASSWFLSGSNSGTATGATVQPVDVQLEAIGTLYPGLAQNAKFIAKNPNAYPVKITGITGPPTVTVTQAPGETGCTAALAGVHLTSALSSGVTVPGNLTVLTHVTNVGGLIKMATTAPPSCAGATFALTFTTVGDIVTAP